MIIKSRKKLYSYLEENALEFKFNTKVSSIFHKFRDYCVEKGRLNLAEMAQWEMDFFNFHIFENDLKCQYSGTTKNGTVFEIPSFKNFSDKTYAYLKKRFEETNNPLLKARYSHLLWFSPLKHFNYAKSTMDSYLYLTSYYENKTNSGNLQFEFNLLDTTVRLYWLSKNVKYQVEYVKEKILELIVNYPKDRNYSYKLRLDLIDIVLNDSKLFSNDDQEKIYDTVWDTATLLYTNNDLNPAINMLELGERIDIKINKRTYNWYLKIAEIYEELSERSVHDINSISNCEKAIEYYSYLKNNKKIEILEKKHQQLKENLQLGESKTEINLKEHIEECKKIARELVEKNKPEGILYVLTNDNNMLPQKNDVLKQIGENAKVSPLSHLINTTPFDQSANPSENFSSPEELEKYHLLQNYDFSIRFDKIYLLNEIIYEGIKAEKITTDNLYKFFSQYSWFGKNLKKKILSKEISYNWLAQIMPALHDYFFQFRHLIKSKYHKYYNLVLPIDSLTIKIEGLFRDFVYFTGIPTTKFIKNKKNKMIAREKDIYQLMSEKPIQDLFDENDLLFFKYLLVEKVGLNLRHKVAHSLMSFDNYSVEIMNLLFICLLKIGKYNFKN